MWACSAAILTTFEPLGQLQPSLTEIRDYKDYTSAVEGEDKRDSLKSCQDKEAKVTMRSVQARKRFSKWWESCSKSLYLSKVRQIFLIKISRKSRVFFALLLCFCCCFHHS